MKKEDKKFWIIFYILVGIIIVLAILMISTLFRIEKNSYKRVDVLADEPVLYEFNEGNQYDAYITCNDYYEKKKIKYDYLKFDFDNGKEYNDEIKNIVLNAYNETINNIDNNSCIKINDINIARIKSINYLDKSDEHYLNFIMYSYDGKYDDVHVYSFIKDTKEVFSEDDVLNGLDKELVKESILNTLNSKYNENYDYKLNYYYQNNIIYVIATSNEIIEFLEYKDDLATIITN